MRTIIEISIEKIMPERTGVLATQGIPSDVPPPHPVIKLYESAEKLFLGLVSPIGITTDITIEEFKNIYAGEGGNEAKTPLENIYPNAEALALFAFTLGKEISDEIERQFNSNNLAMGYMLDAIASFCAEKASYAAEQLFLKRIKGRNNKINSLRPLLYSPGYCGWHISGQRKIFDHLDPGEIGIELTDSFLMIPLKSISGVLIAGNPDIHQFINNFHFCGECVPKTCRGRMKI